MSLKVTSHPNRRKGPVLRIAFALALTVMLIAGLTPGDYRFRNEVNWIEGGPGLQFRRFGIAYTPPFLTPAAANKLSQSGVTLLLGVNLLSVPSRTFQFIASFHNGDDASQLVVGQWLNFLIVMNGDDYSHVRGVPRVSADLTPYLNRPTLLAVSTGPSGTLLTADGEIIGRGDGLQFRIPSGVRNSRLILGNSAHSNTGWSGSLLSFAVLHRSLTGPELREYEGEWVKTHDLRFVPPGETVQLLRFTEKSGVLVRDFSGASNDAVLPAWPTAIERSFLSDDPTRDERRSSRRNDIAVNLLGFIPFGLLFAVLLSNRQRRAGYVIIAVTLCGFAISLGIETIQAWIPTRSSSSLDLLLNTLGAAVGALGSRIMRRGPEV